MNISVCIIGKNEEIYLENCLQALCKYPFEIIFVDTGSTDQTKLIAKKYTSKVFDFTWIDDFSAARNFSISKASNDWVLIVDCDEYLTSFDVPAVHSLIKANPNALGLIHITNYAKTADGKDSYASIDLHRLFNRTFYHFEKIIHEQIVPLSPSATTYSFSAPISIDHHGYAGSIETMEKKALRNRILLLKELEMNPSDPYMLFQIGKTYLMSFDYANALPYLEKAHALNIPTNALYAKDFYVSLGCSLYFTNHLSEALTFCEKYLPAFNSYADFVFLYAFLQRMNKDYLNSLLNFIKCTTLTDFSSAEITTTSTFYNMGCIYRDLGDEKMASLLFSKCPNPTI